MKILFPIGSFYPSQSGGPNNTIYWLAKALFKNGFKPTVMTTQDGILKEHQIQFNKWLDMDCGKVIYQKTLIHYLPFRLYFRTLLEMSKNDIIHLNNLFYPLSWLTAIANVLFFKRKMIWSIRGELNDNALVYSTWKKKPILFLINNFLKKYTLFHATSSEEQQYIKKHFGENTKVQIFPNYMELPQLIDNKKDINTINPYLFYMGRIHPIKALDNLFEGLSISRLFMSSSFKFKIAGRDDSDYAKGLKDLVEKLKLENKIEFLGHLEGNKKQVLFSKASFTFLVSHSENFGNVVVESLAQKTPVVASKGTPWQVLEKDKAGFWIDNSPKQIAEKIDEIIDMPLQEYNEYSKNAYALINEKFNIDKNVEKWISVYKN